MLQVNTMDTLFFVEALNCVFGVAAIFYLLSAIFSTVSYCRFSSAIDSRDRLQTKIDRCMLTGTCIHVPIASNARYVRWQMHPRAEQDIFHQRRSKDEEFATACKIRIHAELHNLFDGLGSRGRTLLAQRVRLVVFQNVVDLAPVAPGAIEAPQERR